MKTPTKKAKFLIATLLWLVALGLFLGFLGCVDSPLQWL